MVGTHEAPPDLYNSPKGIEFVREDTSLCNDPTRPASKPRELPPLFVTCPAKYSELPGSSITSNRFLRNKPELSGLIIISKLTSNTCPVDNAHSGPIRLTPRIKFRGDRCVPRLQLCRAPVSHAMAF